MDKRSEARIQHNVRFFVHVHDCEEDPDLIGVSIACEAVDFSPHGLQFRSDQSLPPGTLLNITIGIGDPFAMYLLRGEVRWSRSLDEDDIAIGILLHDAEGTDLEKWQSTFGDIFS